MNTLKKLWKDERGLETIEYAVIAALIVIGLITTMQSIGGKIHNMFTAIDEQL